jgi:hypothetical protein
MRVTGRRLGKFNKCGDIDYAVHDFGQSHQGLRSGREAAGRALHRHGGLSREAGQGRRVARRQRTPADLEGLAHPHKRTVVDGSFAETKELVAGYTMIQVKSREEALEWTRRFPNPAIDGKDCEIEVRQLFELEDFGEGEVFDRFREIGIGNQK